MKQIILKAYIQVINSHPKIVSRDDLFFNTNDPTQLAPHLPPHAIDRTSRYPIITSSLSSSQGLQKDLLRTYQPQLRFSSRPGRIHSSP